MKYSSGSRGAREAEREIMAVVLDPRCNGVRGDDATAFALSGWAFREARQKLDKQRR
jgi:hypothetical protein